MDIKDNLIPLFLASDENEPAKRFDNLMYQLQVKRIRQEKTTRCENAITETVGQLEKLGTIPQIKEKQELILKVAETDYLKEVDFWSIEEIRIELRDLIQFIDPYNRPPVYIDIEDTLNDVNEEYVYISSGNNFTNYRKKLEKFLNGNLENSVIWKIRHNIRSVSYTHLDVYKRQDPACGTAGFLVAAGEYLRENKGDLFLSENLNEHFNNTMFYGFDMDRTMLRIGAMNLMQHGIENPNISYRDSLSEDNEDDRKYTLVLANPPFKGSIDAERTSKDLLAVTNKTKKTELLFLALFLRILKIGGRCASIVPDGVLFGSSKAHQSIRKEIIENHKLEAVISMPSGVFKPYAGDVYKRQDIKDI